MEPGARFTGQAVKSYWINLQAFVGLILFAWVLAYAPPSLVDLPMN